MIRTMVDLVNRMSEVAPSHRLTLVDARGRRVVFSWNDLHRKMRRHAAWLRAHDIGPGDRVILCPTNDPDVLASFLALFYLGAIPLSVSGAQLGQTPGSQLPFVAGLLERTGAKGIFAQPELVARNEEQELIEPHQIIDFVPPSLGDDQGEDLTPAVVTEDQTAFVQFSSGSTSQPKGARISHRNVITNVRLLVEAGRRSTAESACAWLPLYHDMGLIGTLFATMWNCPRSMVILSPIRFLMRPVSWFEEISNTGARISVCPNFALDLCTDRIRRAQLEEAHIDLSSLEYLFIGAEPVRPHSLRRFEDRFSDWGLRSDCLYPVYGMAEATLIVTAPGHREPVRTRFVDGIEVPSVGRPLGDFSLRVVAESGDPCPVGEVGEIWIKGNSVTDGYLDGGDSPELFTDGWLRTGDLGTLDEEGRLYVTGRLKDLIIVNGRNYYAHDLVDELEKLPFFERGKVHVFSVVCDGSEQVVILTVPVAKMTPEVTQKIELFKQLVGQGGPHGWIRNIPEENLAGWVERLIASDARELINEVKRYVLAQFGIPLHDVVFVPKIPRTTSGKVRRADCEQIYLERRQD